MRLLVQRVTAARVSIDNRVVASIGTGLTVFLGFTHGDGRSEIEWLVHRLVGLRVFPDAAGRMGRSVREVGGSLLLVSQFTLYADGDHGMRPDFRRALDRTAADPLYRLFWDQLQSTGIDCQAGQFGAEMQVALTNWGPVTILLERLSQPKGESIGAD